MLASPHTALNNIAISLFSSELCGFYSFYNTLSVPAVEQLLPLGRRLPHPGVFAAGELLK